MSLKGGVGSWQLPLQMRAAFAALSVKPCRKCIPVRNSDRMTADAGMRFQRSATRPLVAAFLSLAFLWVLALSVSPQLHEFVHADARQAAHSCGVTLISAGNYEHVASQPIVVTQRPTFGRAILLPLTTVSVSLFTGAALLEHAPPAHS
jgi:hypothetical protein